MDIDGLFISSIMSVDKNEFLEAVKYIPNDFVQGEEREIYQWIKIYFKRSKKCLLPSHKALRAKFADFSFQKTEDTLDFYVAELRDRADYHILTDGNTIIQRHLFSKDIENAKKELRKIGISLAKNEMLEASTIKSNLKKRKEKYVKNKKLKGRIGLQTGIDVVDKHIGGMVDEYFVIMGPQGIGKTFLLLLIMCNFWKQVKGPVAIISNEISQGKMEGRIDSFMGGFSYSRYRKGLLYPEEAKKFVGLGEVYKALPELHIIPGAGKSVEQIEYELMSIDGLSALGVDGLYLTDMNKEDEFRNTNAASRAYQRMVSKMLLPAVFTTQMTDKDETKYARAIGEDADIIVKMWRDRAMKDSSLMQLVFKKIREEDSDLEVMLDWNFNKWLFREHVKSYKDSGMEQSYD